jgi:8-oxo-dGTP diphosphatase
MTQPLHVVAAVIRDTRENVLLSLRAPHQDQGGLWEFPGGKVQVGELPLAALGRELREELGIDIDPRAAIPLIRIEHAYPQRTVLLEVWEVFAWRGEPSGLEGQAIEWVAPEHLAERQFPRANLPILSAAQLPRLCLVTPEPTLQQPFLERLEQSLSAGIKLVQLRAKSLRSSEWPTLAARVVPLCHRHSARLLINGPLELVAAVNADGLHLPSQQLHRHASRPVSSAHLLSAACHDQRDIEQANRLGVDFGLLGPVMPTTSHPGAAALGWQRAQRLVEHANFPMFALGGQQPTTVLQAVSHGFQGIAAISGLWGVEGRLPDARLRSLVVGHRQLSKS